MPNYNSRKNLTDNEIKKNFIKEFKGIIGVWLETELRVDSKHKKRELLNKACGIIHTKTIHLLTRCEEHGVDI